MFENINMATLGIKIDMQKCPIDDQFWYYIFSV